MKASSTGAFDLHFTDLSEMSEIMLYNAEKPSKIRNMFFRADTNSH